MRKVIIVNRGDNDAGIECCNNCGFTVEIEPGDWAEIAGAASPLCMDCAAILAEQHPEAFERPINRSN